MADWIASAKDVFFVIGSIAGIVAFFRPVVESKYKSDVTRTNVLLEKLNEGAVMSIDVCTYNARYVPEELFRPFDEIRHKLNEKQQEVRFIGPLRRYLTQELTSLIGAYDKYRSFVQVPEWEPRKYGDTEQYAWFFNKGAFIEGGKLSDEYVTHLDAATQAAELIKSRFKRFQALTELHFYEAIAAKYFVYRKFKSIGLNHL